MERLDRLVWVDVETTGLDPDYNAILEVAVVVTDGDLVELAAASWVCAFPNPIDDGGHKQAISPVVMKMHTDNNLWQECARSDLTMYDVDLLTSGFVDFHAPYYKGPICGSSPHFDKAFLDVSMPFVASKFNHRAFDASTLKQAFMQQYTPITEPAGDVAHRALSDIRASIQSVRFSLTLLQIRDR